MKPKKPDISNLYTFPMWVWLKGNNPWKTDSIIVNGITVTTSRMKIYTMQDFIRLRPIMAYIGKEAILNEEHSIPTETVTEAVPYIKEEKFLPPVEKIKEELPKDIAYSIEIPQMKIIGEKVEEEKKEEKKVKKTKKDKDVIEESLYIEDKKEAEEENDN